MQNLNGCDDDDDDDDDDCDDYDEDDDDHDEDFEDFHPECVRVIRRGVKLMVGTFVPLCGGEEWMIQLDHHDDDDDDDDDF